MTEYKWMTCPKCGAWMNIYTGYSSCPICGYRVPATLITTSTSTNYTLTVRHQSVDVVQVIRCKDCKWYEPRILKCNNSKSTEWKPDDYCSDAERKEE